MTNPVQLALFDLGKRRCHFCARPMKRPYCKTCTKGGIGEAPPIESKAYWTWHRALVKTATKLLEDAGLPWKTVQAGINATFFDQGDVPPETRLFLAPYLARACSPRRYQDAIDQGVTHHFLLCHLAKLGYGSREADEMALDAARRIYDQRRALRADPNLPKVHEAELLAETVFTHEARSLFAGSELPKDAIETRVREHVAEAMKDHRGRYDRPKVRVAVPVPKLRVAVNETHAVDELLAAEEEAALAELEQVPARRRRQAGGVP